MQHPRRWVAPGTPACSLSRAGYDDARPCGCPSRSGSSSAAGRGGGDDADGKALLELDELDRVSRESRAKPTEVP